MNNNADFLFNENFEAGGNWRERFVYRDALCDWLVELEFEHFVTLNFNRETSLAAAKRKFGGWLARIDRACLGRRWSERCSVERCFAIAFLENPLTNLHYHVLLRFPEAARTLSVAVQAAICMKHWQKLVPGGQCDVRALYDAAGAICYATKQLHRFDRGDAFVLATEFHRQGN